MMPALSARTVAGVPLLVGAPQGVHGPLPLVLWFHGFGVDAAANAAELARLAAAGYLAAGVDAVGHGRRRLPDLPERQAAPRAAALHTMATLAEATALEMPSLVDALVREGSADAERIAAVGVSMGGYLVYRAIVAAPAIRAAVAILGSPEWPYGDAPGGDSPHLRLDAMRRVALLSITAERDESVPPDAARRLHARLAESHARPASARYEELPGEPHLLSADAWERAMSLTLHWLDAHVGRATH